MNTSFNEHIINVFPYFCIIALRIPDFNIESSHNTELASVVAITGPGQTWGVDSCLGAPHTGLTSS